MERLLTVFLRHQLQQYQLRHAFAILKNYDRPQPVYLSFRDQQAFGSVPSVEIENRQQYLKYMEEVLLNKEKELGQLEQNLTEQKKQQEMEEARTSIIGPLALTHQSETLNKKIKVFKQIMLKYVTILPELALDSGFQELIDSLQMVEVSCKNNYNSLKNELLKNHQSLSLQREQLASKLTKLKELQSYEKYLNELQKILQNKEYQLIERQSQLQELNSVPRVSAPGFYQPDPQQYTTFQEENTAGGQSQVSVRKRKGIFQQRSDKEDQLHKESSKIMQEILAEDTVPQVNPDSYTTTIDSSREKDQQQSKSLGIQTIIEDPRVSTACRINSSTIYIKFLKLWFKVSGNGNKGTPQHSATMLLYRWRVNALYDEGIAVSAREILVWPKKCQRRGDLPFEDYARLSLKKQVYLQNYFDFERKKFQKKKMQSIIGSILKSKNRKERLAVLLTFRKYRQIVKLSSLLRMEKSQCSYREYPLRQVTTQNSQNMKSSQINKQSRLLSNSSLFVEENQKISYSKSKISKKSGIQSSHIKPKGNAKDLNVDLTKLKDYIKTQEATEARLATECAQTQSVFRLANVLKRRVSSFHHHFMVGLIRWDEDNRADELYQVVSSYEFKWELFMAKARLALTSNSNKVAHLEQLVSFIDK